jgi:hypothetical protein
VGFVFEVEEGKNIFDFGIKGNIWRAQTQDYQAEIRRCHHIWRGMREAIMTQQQN